MNYEGEKFLLKLYRELYSKESVKHSGTISDNKYELINKYLKRLEKTERIFLSENEEMIKYLKNRYYDKYVIKKEDIQSNREDTKQKIINSQKESLDKWIDYLMKEETSYPMWTRYWAFQGMLQLGKFDKDNKKFTNRSKKTTMPFVELNKDALKKSIELAIDSLNENKPNNEELEVLISNGSFSKVYAYFISKQIDEQKDNSTEKGIWKTYRYGEAIKLANDLNGKITGWCITSETIAKNYLEYGSIHVYYTKDEHGDYTVPRICIRQEDINVVEVKGVLDSFSNLEYSMIDIAIEKLDKLHGSEQFIKTGVHLKKLTAIEEKNNKGIPLSTEDLMFLYEVNEKILSFTDEKDYRIDKILNQRNAKEDLSKVFNCNIDEIGTNKEELTSKKVKVYYGDIDYTNDDNIIVPKVVLGNIYLNESIEIKGFDNLEIVSGSLLGENLITADNLISLRQVNNSINFPNLKNAKGLENLQKVGKTVVLSSLNSLEGLSNLKETGNLLIKSATSSKGLENLRIVYGTLDISKMIDLSYLENLKQVERNIICYASSSLNQIPEVNVKGDIHFYHLINIHNVFGRQRTR